MSMTFKKYWYLSFFRRNLNLQDPFPRYHQHLLQYIDCKVMFFVHVCAKCVCSDLRTTLSHLFWRVNVLYFVGIGSQPQKTGRHRNSPHRKSSHATMMVETGNHYRYGNGNMAEKTTTWPLSNHSDPEATIVMATAIWRNKQQLHFIYSHFLITY